MQSYRSEFFHRRLACAYFFLCPGIAYGLFTSRLPALKAQTGADEAQIGLFLLSMGGSSLLALLTSSWFIRRWGSSLVLRFSSASLMLATILCGLAPSPLVLGCFCVLFGLSMGFLDVTMNTQGVENERLYRLPCMAFMHAAYSLGGVLGAVTASLFAALNLGLFANALVVLGLYALLRPWTVPYLLPDSLSQPSGKKADATGKKRTPLPFLVLVCGCLSMFAYAAEGSVAEWGSLLLFAEKGAHESTAAFVFAAFSGTTVLCRLFGDRLRQRLGDFALCLGGGLLATAGLATVLLSSSPLVCLCAYACMGAGLSPLVPIYFSRAGRIPGVNPAAACALVSTFSYSGLLFFPPMLGFVAHAWSLGAALHIIYINCLCVALGAFLLRKRA